MILYDVKLICLETQKVIFTSLNPKPVLPPEELLKKQPRPVLIINTVDSAVIEKNKKTA